ncbi:myb dna-binding domain-containing [Trichoderma arundinaceum]|uniref:Myb dna-binding domain-containing n=1 Tax=Trichoderma arundinaceum TaxID=490622 RepID=A0A395NTY8_TRIAR|nr:myb dna-binding domain-containing [Trichoderma arundinaceum]
MGEDSRGYLDDAGSTSSTHWPSHHHHRLPDVGRSLSSMHGERDEGSSSMVGQEGMPSPARRPQRPRIKFTPEEDQLLIELKEQKHLTWRQIADFFPGRNPGTLQVRYCTKLKVEATPWTREMDERLLHALQSYEDEKWRIVAQRVGGGVTPMGCCDRVWELFNDDLDDASSFPFANEG